MALDQSTIIVNIGDSPKLQYNGSLVKRKATVLEYIPITNTTKDFKITTSIQLYINNAGSYGGYIISDIIADNSLSQEEKDTLTQIYADKTYIYETHGKWTDPANGNLVVVGTVGAVTDAEYWQTFKINQVAGIGTPPTQGALDTEYLIIKMIVAKLNLRKRY